MNNQPTSLIACPDCARPCSSNASACIHCGAPLRAPSYLHKDIGAAGVFYGLLIVAGLALVVISCSPLPLIFVAAGGLLLAVRLKGWIGTARR